jgi:hypothetical protein
MLGYNNAIHNALLGEPHPAIATFSTIPLEKFIALDSVFGIR